MALLPAPYFHDIAGGPQAEAHWATSQDGVRIRMAFWPLAEAKGTVLLFPGRTEYLEKYGITAGELAARGYAMVSIDWRGQGLADRLIDDRRVGHVTRFPDYQKDVAAALEIARRLGAPEPWHLIGHSMGGAIGLRAVLEGLPVKSCTFTGPMWGISMSTLMRPLGWALPRVASLVGMGTRLPPTTTYAPYVLDNPFEGNMLTTDRDMYLMMQSQLGAQPGLALGGPSLIWLREGLQECKYLMRQSAPDLPCLTFLGEDERIIDTAAVHERMRRWPRGELVMVSGAQHEVLMERPALRNSVLDRMADLWAGHVGQPDAAKRA